MEHLFEKRFPKTFGSTPVGVLTVMFVSAFILQILIMFFTQSSNPLEANSAFISLYDELESTVSPQLPVWLQNGFRFLTFGFLA
jgi:fluoride ion exporter CrcB/FEX